MYLPTNMVKLAADKGAQLAEAKVEIVEKNGFGKQVTKDAQHAHEQWTKELQKVKDNQKRMGSSLSVDWTTIGSVAQDVPLPPGSDMDIRTPPP